MLRVAACRIAWLWRSSFLCSVRVVLCFFSFFFNDTATTEIFDLSLHDALPICKVSAEVDLVHQQTQNQRYGSSHIGATAKDSLRRKRSSPNVFEMAATETITSIILIKLIRVSLGTVRHPRR